MPVDIAGHWLNWQRGQLERPCTRWLEMGPTFEEREVAKFLREWPTVSELIGLAPPPAVCRLFDPGRIWFACHAAPAVYLPQWRAYLQRHTVDGDFGLNGKYTEDDLTYEQIQNLPDEPPAVQARYAIRTGRGAVVSRYLPGKETQDRFPAIAYQDKAVRSIIVVSVLMPAMRRTVMSFDTHLGGLPDAESRTTHETVAV